MAEDIKDVIEAAREVCGNWDDDELICMAGEDEEGCPYHTECAELADEQEEEDEEE